MMTMMMLIVIRHHHIYKGHLEVTQYWIMMTIMTITITRNQIWRSLNRRHGKHLFLLHRLSSHCLPGDLPHLRQLLLDRNPLFCANQNLHYMSKERAKKIASPLLIRFFRQTGKNTSGLPSSLVSSLDTSSSSPSFESNPESGRSDSGLPMSLKFRTCHRLCFFLFKVMTTDLMPVGGLGNEEDFGGGVERLPPSQDLGLRPLERFRP